MIIYIEGNIGSGKSTFLELLGPYLSTLTKYGINSSIVLEPVDLWMKTKDSDGQNILEKFYGDQDKWSFAFQMNSFISRVKAINDNTNPDTNPDKIVFVERSIYTDRNCFSKLCYENGKMTKLEYDIYCNWNEWLSSEFNVKPNAYIYLQCNPNVNSERICQRSRDGENNIPLEYLEKLHQKHEEWMNYEKQNIPVFTINALDNFKDTTIMDEIFGKLLKFILGL